MFLVIIISRNGPQLMPARSRSVPVTNGWSGDLGCLEDTARASASGVMRPFSAPKKSTCSSPRKIWCGIDSVQARSDGCLTVSVCVVKVTSVLEVNDRTTDDMQEARSGAAAKFSGGPPTPTPPLPLQPASVPNPEHLLALCAPLTAVAV